MPFSQVERLLGLAGAVEARVERTTGAAGEGVSGGADVAGRSDWKWLIAVRLTPPGGPRIER